MTTTHSVVLVNKRGADTVSLTLSLPNGAYPFEGLATADIKIASEGGEEYSKRHFPDVPTSIIDLT